jgi:hypothetical protein
MTNRAVADLTSSGALTGTELFYADNGANDVKVTAEQIKTFAVADVEVGVPEAADLLAALLTVDGSGSGLDADKLDGINAADFLTEAEATAAYQPLDSDLTSIAALVTTAYGRGLLTLANAGALANEVDSVFLTPTEGDAAYQPLDSDLTAIAALATSAAGRSILTYADPNADRLIWWDDSDGTLQSLTVGDVATEAAPASGDFFLSLLSDGSLVKVDFDNMPGGEGSGIAAVVEDTSPELGGSLDGGGFDITNVDDATFDTLTVTDDAYDATGWNGSALVPTKNAIRDKIEGLSSVYQPLDADLTAIAGLTSAADKGIYFTGSGTAAVYDLTAYGRTLGGLADETALEALLDTLPNLTSVQGQTVTLADAGANAFFGWDDVAGAYENLTAAEAEAIIEPLIDTLANLTSIQGVSFTFGAYAATLLNNANEAAFKAAVNLEANTDFYAPGGTDVALADGGTGASLADPNADRFMFWDDSAAAVKFAALADFTTEAAPAAGDYLLVQRAEDEIVKVNWSSLPGSGGISNVVEDTSPTLGGSLDAGDFDITNIGDMFVNDANGAVVGHTAQLATFRGINSSSAATPEMQVLGTSADDSMIGIARFSNNNASSYVSFAKSRGTTIGDYTVAADGDLIGSIMWSASDGTDMTIAAAINVQVDGSPGDNDMPGAIRFLTTADGAQDLTLRWIIDSSGRLKPNTDAISDIGTTSVGTGDIYVGAGQYIEMKEGSAPAAGAANTARLFIQDNGGGKTQLCVQFASGSAQVIATEA